MMHAQLPARRHGALGQIALSDIDVARHGGAPADLRTLRAWLAESSNAQPRSCGCGGACSNCLGDELTPRTPDSLDEMVAGLREPAATPASRRAETASRSAGCGCGGACSQCLQAQASPRSPAAPFTEPVEELDEEDMKPFSPAPDFKPGKTPGVPIDASKAAGAVACNKGNFQVWLNPTNSPCINDCARKHEEKHISDFQADPKYKDICKGVPDGETFNYLSCDDAAKFEDAASDVEIDCLNNAIPGASKACQPIMTNRKDVTLPNYKKQVRAGCGC
jgi:hypothetical protein